MVSVCTLTAQDSTAVGKRAEAQIRFSRQPMVRKDYRAKEFPESSRNFEAFRAYFPTGGWRAVHIKTICV